MPVVFGTLITAVTYNEPLGLVIDGQAFADTQYPGVSNIEIALTGSGLWSSVPVIVSWSDIQIQATLGGIPAAGDYDVRVTSSDGEVSPISIAAFNVVGNATKENRIWIGIGIGI